jgi:hypothetical protein
MDEDKKKERVTAYGCLEYRHDPRPRSPEEIALKESIRERFQCVAMTRDIAALDQLAADFQMLGIMRAHRHHLMIYDMREPFYPNNMRVIKDRVLELLPDAFKQPVQPPITEDEIHGYPMQDGTATFKMGHGFYLAMYREWHRTDQLTGEAFATMLDDICCSDWSKIDFLGIHRNGFYDYPEGSYEHENAWELTRKKNLDALLSLPYPSRAIIEAINVGCESGWECVSAVVLCCEWFKRKLEQMKDFPPSSYMNTEKE